MNKDDYKMVDLDNRVSIPVPKGLTPEAEAQYIEKFKAEHMANFEEEYEELTKMVEGKVPTYSLKAEDDIDQFLEKLFDEAHGEELVSQSEG
jgi:hypothetical protein